MVRVTVTIKALVEAEGGDVVAATEYNKYAIFDTRPTSVWRRLLGDEAAVGVIIAYDSSDELAETALIAFPEAELWRWTADGRDMENITSTTRERLKRP